MEAEFLNGWKQDDRVIFPYLSFGLWVSKYCVFTISYEHEEAYPSLLIVLFNFGFQFNFTK
jgi:hypothetical protein